MTDTREQVERLNNLITRMMEGEGFHDDYDRACGDLSDLRALLSRLEAAEAERDAVIEGADFAKKRLEMIADENWTGDARDFKRSIAGVFADMTSTPTDAQTALDRMKEEARLEERERCSRIASEQTRSPAFFLTIAEQKSWNGACEKIAAAIREGK